MAARTARRALDPGTSVASASRVPHLHAAHTGYEYSSGVLGRSLPADYLVARPGLEARTATRATPEPAHPTRGPGLDPTRDAEQIREHLDPTAHPLTLDYGVTRSDVDAVRGIVDRFPSVEHGSRVLAALSPAELQRWADNLDDHALQGGLDAGERREHYAALARHLDSTQIGRFAEAVVEGAADGDREGRWFGSAAAATAPTESLAGFTVQATARGREQDDMRLAPAVAEAVHGLGDRDPAGLARVLIPYTKEDTVWLVSGAVIERLLETGPAGPRGRPASTVEHDAASLSRALSGVARAGNVETKGLFFAAAAEQMAALREQPIVDLGVVHVGTEEAAGHVREGLSHIVNSDTAGVMDTLARQAGNETGWTTVAYVEALLDAGQTGRVRSTLDRLQHGNTHRETADARFGREGELTPTQAQKDNAFTLGQYVGAVAGALENRFTDHQAQVEALSDVFADVLTIGVSGAGPSRAGGRLVQGAASALAEPLAESLAASVNRFSAGDQSLRATLLEIARPQVPNESPKGGFRPHQANTLTSEFTTAYSLVTGENHRPRHQ